MSKLALLAILGIFLLVPSVFGLTMSKAGPALHAPVAPHGDVSDIAVLKKPVSPNGDYSDINPQPKTTGGDTGASNPKEKKKSGGGTCVTAKDSFGNNIDLVSNPITFDKNSKFDFSSVSPMFKSIYSEEEVNGRLVRRFVLDGDYCLGVKTFSSANGVIDTLPINWWKIR